MTWWFWSVWAQLIQSKCHFVLNVRWTWLKHTGLILRWHNGSFDEMISSISDASELKCWCSVSERESEERWMNDGENSIKAQRCIFHSTNKDNRNQNVVCCVCSSTFILHCYKLLVQVQQFVTNPKQNSPESLLAHYFWIYFVSNLWALASMDSGVCLVKHWPLVSCIQITSHCVSFYSLFWHGHLVPCTNLVTR